MSRITSIAHTSGLRWPLVYTGVFLTTLATLMLELTLTRIFSVVFYYHFAFLAISIALFGLGAGGVFSYVVLGWPGSVWRKLAVLSTLNAFFVVLSVYFVLSRTAEMTNAALAGVYVVSALPFLIAGIIVSVAISETIERVDRVYFFDLLGAAGGCLFLIPLLNTIGAPNTVIGTGVLFASASALWYTLAGSVRMRIVSVGVALGLVLLIVGNAKNRMIDVRTAKGMELTGERFVKWNSYSRIAIQPDKHSSALLIVIDGDASTGIANFNFDKLTDDERANLLKQGPGLPYALRPGAKTLIIGPGGGWDVSRALAGGSKDITGVEINKIIANTIMRERFADLSQRIYFRPEVRIFVEDGRSFVRRSTEKYQVLQATLVDTWASTAAGAFSLSENNLYTTDAFHDYLSHLTDDGILAFTRWGFQPPRESLRLITLAVEALESLGERDVARHFLVARENTHLLKGWGATDTVIISRKPLSDADVSKARLLFAESKMETVYAPDMAKGNAFAQFLHTKDREAFFRGYPFDVTPVSDDKPFFFYTVQPRDIWTYLSTAVKDSADYKINRAVPLLFGVVGISIFGTLVTLLLPPLVLGSRLPAERGVRLFLLYFLCVGIGYILIQVALIQRFVLFLGHPQYALTVIIFSMLLSSGTGSYWSRRLGTFEDGPLRKVLVGVTVCVTGLALVSGPIVNAGVGWPLAVRMLVTALLIFPAGFLMGMPFPSGLARLEAMNHSAVRWAWALNAAASVMGSAGAIFLALYIGLRATLITGGVLYLVALVVLTMAAERPATMREQETVTT
ncbi:MAG: hypothetical protein IPJ98_27795 [Bryobacterales bacterium]|nr:hypothetical protein [Bryobacterales bacterium]